MTIYIGYIIGDYAHALYMSTNREKVKKELEKINRRNTYIVEYTIKENNLIELDCD